MEIILLIYFKITRLFFTVEMSYIWNTKREHQFFIFDRLVLNQMMSLKAIRGHMAIEEHCFFLILLMHKIMLKFDMFLPLLHDHSGDSFPNQKHYPMKKTLLRNHYQKTKIFPEGSQKGLHLTTEYLQNENADASSSSSYMTINLKCVSF